MTMTPTHDARFLVCRIRDLVSAIPLTQVIETMRVLPPTPLEETPSWVLGVSLIRGVPTPLIDVGRMLSGDDDDHHATRIVTVRTSKGQAALAVEEILGVVALPADSFAETVPLLEHAANGVIAAAGRLDRSLLVVLESSRLVPETVWQAMEGSKA